MIGPMDAARFLQDATATDEAAETRTFDHVYEKLRKIAHGYMRRERAEHSLEPTELVNEAILKLAPGIDIDAVTRCRLVGFAARAMRQVLVDHARKGDVRARAGQVRRMTLRGVAEETSEKSVPLRSLLSSLEWLETEDARLAEMIEWHYFGGMTSREMATHLDTSRATVNRELALGRALLLSRIDRLEADRA